MKYFLSSLFNFIKNNKLFVFLLSLIILHTSYTIYLVLHNGTITKINLSPANIEYAGISDPVMIYLAFLLNLAVITPILEEVMFRSWVKFKFQNIYLISIFCLLILQMYSSIARQSGPWQIILSLPFNIFQDWLVSIFGYKIYEYVSSMPDVFHRFRGATFVIIFIWILQYILSLKKINLGHELSKFFGRIPIYFLLTINGLLFFLYHTDRWENGISLETWIFFVPFCFVFGFIAYRFGIKASIYLHSFSNFIVFYLKISDLTPLESGLYNLFYSSITIILIYLFIREIRLGLAR